MSRLVELLRNVGGHSRETDPRPVIEAEITPDSLRVMFKEIQKKFGNVDNLPSMPITDPKQAAQVRKTMFLDEIIPTSDTLMVTPGFITNFSGDNNKIIQTLRVQGNSRPDIVSARLVSDRSRPTPYPQIEAVRVIHPDNTSQSLGGSEKRSITDDYKTLLILCEAVLAPEPPKA